WLARLFGPRWESKCKAIAFRHHAITAGTDVRDNETPLIVRHDRPYSGIRQKRNCGVKSFRNHRNVCAFYRAIRLALLYYTLDSRCRLSRICLSWKKRQDRKNKNCLHGVSIQIFLNGGTRGRHEM